MNNSVRICLLASNLAYPFVSSNGVKLVLPNLFFLPVCLVECSLDGKILSLLLLITWFYCWVMLLKMRGKLLPVLICQSIFMVHVGLLAYDAIVARSFSVLLTVHMLPSYIVLVCYLVVCYECYLFRFKPTFQNSK